MEINVEKTKSMVVSKINPVPRANITLVGAEIKQTANMVYLGHIITADGKNETEIKRRIEIARSALDYNMSKILTSRSIRIETTKRLVKCYIWSTLLYGPEIWSLTRAKIGKIEALEMWIYRRMKILTSRSIRIETTKRLVKCYIWSTLLYGPEIWSLTRAKIGKIEAFEMWIYRRMLKILSNEHRTNEYILQKMNTRRSLINTIKQRKCVPFGHPIRGDGLQRLLLEGRFNGKRGRGRLRATWFNNIKEWIGMSYAEATRKA